MARVVDKVAEHLGTLSNQHHQAQVLDGLH